MIPELGHLALILALALAAIQAVLPLMGAHRGHAGWMALAKPAARGQCLFVALAYGCLTHAFVTGDFSVQLAAQHSNSQLPLVYRFTAVWGNHEGSILLWALILAGWTLAVSLFSRELDAPRLARVLGVMGIVSCGFLLFTLLTSNPFTRLLPAAPDGNDLNPMLQDPGMVLHPPLLYMGYVGLVVAFAFAVAALLEGRLDAAWARWSRPWTTTAWCFLTVGIALGSFWAYYELGWGGWWFWDPVENASFLPWLVSTALIHSLAVTDRRGALRLWTALLAIVAFSLSLLGTFIVRSGVLSSVHAFATDPARGLFILGFLAVVAGGALTLFAWRAPQLAQPTPMAPLSREALLLGGNMVLVVVAAAVLLGTLYPLLIDALGLGKLSVGPPYFNAVFVPLMVPALLLMGVTPAARWHAATPASLWQAMRPAVAASVVLTSMALLTLDSWRPLLVLGLLLSAWVACSTAGHLVARLHAHPAPRWRERWAAQPGSFYGMLVAHAGVAVFIAGVTVVSGFQSESDVRLEPGQTVEAGGYRFRLDSVQPVAGPNYMAAQAVLQVTRDGEPVATLRPERRLYTVTQSTMTEVAIDRGWARDLYVALGAPVSATAWGVRVHHKPLVNWIWGGCLLMALGGLLAVASRVRQGRLAPRARAAATGAAMPVVQPAWAVGGPTA